MGNKTSFANWMPEVTPVSERDAGSVSIDNCGPFVAGSYCRFVLTYVAGRYGIDDTGSLKICYRFASDMGRLQFSDPTAPNWVSVTASNGATLEIRFDYKQNTRPWDRTLYIKVAAGFLKQGDTITVSFGTDARGPGMRMQTFVDPEFCFRGLVDPIATYTYVEVPNIPIMPVVAGPAARWQAILPTCRAVGDVVALCIRAEDMWGNPTDDVPFDRLGLKASGPVEGVPRTISFGKGKTARRIEGLRVAGAGEIQIDVMSDDRLVAQSNKLVIVENLDLRPFWGDLHAQSGETIGSGSIEDYMQYARDAACLDVIGHQGNDFQITPEFWRTLNTAMKEWDEPGRFVTIPGYEWSGNTALGGDRNVFYRHETGTIHRSSHALVADRADIATDCWDARELFNALGSYQDTVVWAHCGGRYADIAYAHDHALERSVEVHSSWGTFEWLADDAFREGYRVGIVGNSDGHKGRPGYESPGASMFGALGGLTCYWMPSLTRDDVFDALHARHHYATSGSRVHLAVSSDLNHPATIWIDDPRIEGARSKKADRAIMGDIVTSSQKTAKLMIDLASSAAILSLEIRRGSECLETIRPHATSPLGRRLRIEWSGAEYRGRARQTTWDGSLKLSGGRIVSAKPINFLNPDRPLKQTSDTELQWSSITTGNVAGIDLILSDDDATFEIETPMGSVKKKLTEIDHTPFVESYGKLARELRISRQPADYSVFSLHLERSIRLIEGDNPLWICAAFEDGHQAWSSPIYFIPE
jgi:hypothetical protein